jgi:hypothetical protein
MDDTFIRNEAGECIHVSVELIPTDTFHAVRAMIGDTGLVMSLKEGITLGRLLSEIKLPKLR